ncbi:hypothetical protein [Blautia sp.]|uniref:hypothetical protein n=1 Tax=Blautia sp. TaxID=1955243 RepID=UPI003AB23903
MKVGIIDADLIGRKKHRFPNLVSEKISAYWKEKGAEVELKLDYEDLDVYDHVYISKVFTDTPFPKNIVESDRIHMGGTGFYFDKAPNLPDEIEHHMPDYHLYDAWIDSEVEKARKNHDDNEEAEYQKLINNPEYDEKGKLIVYEKKDFDEVNCRSQFKEYTDYSIGFVTRGCFRKCPFCVNQKYDRVFRHSPIDEFYDPDRKKVCLLDDNVLGCPEWKSILTELINLKKPFKFKQGMDERLLTDEKCEMLFGANYDGDYTFAFDNISDYDLIHKKLQLIRKYTSATNIKFYVLVGFESTDAIDIENMWKRVALLMEYRCLPYIMRYQNKNDTPWKMSKYKGIYITMARWCNQPSFLKKMSFREYCLANQKRHKTEGTLCAAMRALTLFETEHPEIAKKYFDLKFK